MLANRARLNLKETDISSLYVGFMTQSFMYQKYNPQMKLLIYIYIYIHTHTHTHTPLIAV